MHILALGESKQAHPEKEKVRKESSYKSTKPELDSAWINGAPESKLRGVLLRRYSWLRVFVAGFVSST
jgi:hypothetical protein